MYKIRPTNGIIDGISHIQYYDEIEQSDVTMPYMNYIGLEELKRRFQENIIHTYSKRKEGSRILETISPSILEAKSRYLKVKFSIIRNLG